MAVRLKDIAQDLGLSVVTISKALRNHPDIAEETRMRILARVKELDYQPNLMARSLVTGRSYLVGLVVPSLLHPFFAEVARSLSSVIGRQGYSLILASSEEDPELEAREIQQMTARRLDALVIATSGADAGPLERLQANGMPYVLIDREISGLETNFVGVDDVAVGRMATSHLVQQGCKRVAHIRGRDNSTGLRRFEGYRQALKKAGHEFSEDLVVARSNVDVDSTRMGAEAMRLLLRRKPRPDAVFAYNDPLAIGAMEAILDAGLRIPQDIAVIGCGNLHYNESLRVPLSSIDQRSSLIGERTAAILLHAIASKTPPRPVSVILDPSLVVRGSSLRKASTQPATRSKREQASKRAHAKKS
ncbi:MULTISPECIES: LacI family DNA-binding transcriptional regulator [Acidobacterium]|uniref:LacI family DNA-binding transcriptional regulator n=1 Tax=Acidobacterium TaxID=33973 RepID=UPI0002FC0DB9|nr:MULTISPECIES: LacI family DNA-binding transcriptional regulator [Acidobacterium]HCT61107.1 LacI family transcriptional regulator [Acidobacterium sp.]